MPKPTENNFGEMVKKFRDIKAFSQAELGRKSGLKREYISKIEGGDLKNPTLMTIRKISKGLGVSAGALIVG